LKAHYPGHILLRSISSDLAGGAPLILHIAGQVVAENNIGFLNTPRFWYYKQFLAVPVKH
jgi:hypothetical protein